MSWRIFQRWFNAPPTKDAKYITDNRNETFWIYWIDKFERAAELRVWYHGNWVGVINLLREEDSSITLADINIFERYQLRGYGLGYAMMQELIHWAKEKKFREISGVIKPHDGSTMDEMREWYKRQGCEVYEAMPGRYEMSVQLRENYK